MQFVQTAIHWLLSIILLLTPLPYLCKFSTKFQQAVIFGKWGRFVVRNLTNLEPYGFAAHEYRSLKITTDDRIQLGVWLIYRLGERSLTNPDIDTVIYVHGSSFDRDKSDRISLYKVLRTNYHVITFDFRGFGDSSGTSPSEQGVVNDTKSILLWSKTVTQSNKIHVWGHSLGAAILVEAFAHFNDFRFQKVILECAFNNLMSEIPEHNFAKYFHDLPIFDYFITKPLSKNGERFRTNETISSLNSSILMLHAEDDDTIPLNLALELFNAIRNSKDVKMIIFDKRFKFNHENINKYANLTNIISDFINCKIEEQIQVIHYQ